MTPATVTDIQTAAPTVTAEQLDLVRRTVANGATDAELKLFLYDCARRGVHPLDRLIHFTKRKGKYTPITSIDFMRSQAAATGEMAGSDDAVFYLAEGWPQSATVTVYRLTAGHRFGYTATARYDEYKPEAGTDFMWKQKPFLMLAKCAESLALRKAFPQQLAGLYTAEEFSGTEQPSEPAVGVSRPAAAAAVQAVPDITIPAGYFFIKNYWREQGWHHVIVQAADEHLEQARTKLATIGQQLHEAWDQKQLVALDLSVATKKNEPRWVNRVEVYVQPADLEAAEAVRDSTDNPPA